ncbi:MAG: GNAT family N-acetyltransferase [Candidatus Eremiobacteraeota bacterium]|nr:GNAT family N-acetyltransferase [Candidatus Eremiobacteraeota bacterium]
MIAKDLILQNERVRLEPLAFAHAADLFVAGNDDAVWNKAGRSNQMATIDGTHLYIAEALYGTPEVPAGVPFAVIDRQTGKAIGSTRYFDISYDHARLEIGWTWIAQAQWRTAINTNCKFLLLQYAFEHAQMNRVQFKADAENDRSRAAISRLGATYEGTLRDLRILEGKIRSVSYYSILGSEWPEIKQRLLAFLSARSGAVEA